MKAKLYTHSRKKTKKNLQSAAPHMPLHLKAQTPIITAVRDNVHRSFFILIILGSISYFKNKSRFSLNKNNRKNKKNKNQLKNFKKHLTIAFLDDIIY